MVVAAAAVQSSLLVCNAPTVDLSSAWSRLTQATELSIPNSGVGRRRVGLSEAGRTAEAVKTAISRAMITARRTAFPYPPANLHG